LVTDFPREHQAIAAFARASIAVGDEINAWLTYQTWVQDHPDKEAAYAAYADFLISRASIPEALSALERLAEVKKGAAKAAIFTRCLDLVARTRPDEIDPLEYHRKRMDAEPEEDSHKLAYLEAVQQISGPERALKELDRLIPNPGVKDSWMDLRIKLLLELDRGDQALAFLEKRVQKHPTHDEFLRLGKLLRKLHRFEEVVANLEEGYRSNTLDAMGLERLFHWMVAWSYQRELFKPDEAARAWRRLEALWRPTMDRSHLRRLAAGWELLGTAPEQIRLLYRVTQETDPADQQALRRSRLDLLQAMQSANSPGTLLAHVGQVARWPYSLDPHPGVLSGALSFWMNGLDVGSEIAGLGENLGADQAFGRLDTWIAEEYQKSPGAPDWEPILQARAQRLARQGRPLEAADDLLRLAQDSSDARFAARIRMDALDKIRRAPRAMREVARPNMERWARKIYQNARQRGWKNLSRRAFSLLEESLRAREARDEVLALYRSETTGENADANAYQRFLDLLTGYGFHEEAEQVFDRAISRFGGKDWFSRAARWYLRRKRRSALGDLSRRAVEALSGPDLASFLGSFLRFSKRGSGAARDSRLYLEVYRAAHQRFPHDLRFVEGLVRYHSSFGNIQERDRLRFLYGYRLPDLWKGILQDRMSRHGLRGTIGALAAQGPENLVATEYLARAYDWLSEFELTQPLRQRLSALCPDEEALLVATARGLRSAGTPLKAERIYLNLFRRHPTLARWPTLVGEVRMEAGDPEGAQEAWISLIDTRRGEASAYLEVATLLWDYYLFAPASEVLKKARKELSQPHLYAKELSAILESHGLQSQASQEIVRHLVYLSPWDSEMQYRLERLRKKGQASAIEQAFEEFWKQNPARLQTLEVFLRYLQRGGTSWDLRRQTLQQALAQSSSLEVVDWVGKQARRQKDPILEEASLRRRLALRGRATPDLFALLRFLFQSSQGEAGAKLIQELQARANHLPSARWGTARQIHRQLGDLLLAHGRNQVGFRELEAAVKRSLGRALEQEQSHLARRYLKAGLLKQARSLLSDLIEASPESLQWVEKLASVAREQDNLEGVQDVYETALKRISGLPDVAASHRKNLLHDLRLRWAQDLAKMDAKMPLAVVLRELVEASPGDRELATEATRLARFHGVLERFLKPLRKWAKDSPKDFRAHRLLAWIALAMGQQQKAVDHLQRALREEPQRQDLRLQRAELLRSLGRPQLALEEFQKLAKIGPEEARTYASAQASLWLRLGKSDQALQALAPLRPPALTTEQEALSLESYAEALWNMGEKDTALARLQELFDHLEENRLALWTPSYTSVRNLISWSHQRLGPVQTLEKIQERIKLLDAWNSRSGRGVSLRRQAASQLKRALRGQFLQEVRTRGTAATRRQMHMALKRLDLSGVAHPDQVWRRSGFEDLLLQFLRAPVVRGVPRPERFREKLWDHLAATNRLDDLEAELLKRSHRGESWQRARIWKALASLRARRGDRSGELEALSRVPGSGKGNWYLNEGERRRYLDLILDLKGDGAFRKELGRHGLWGLNEALRRQSPEIALELLKKVATRKKSQGPFSGEAQPSRWELEARTLIQERFPNQTPSMDQSFQLLLDLRPLGELVERAPDPAHSWTDGHFFPAALRYAKALRRQGSTPRALAYASALLEGRPRSSKARLETARLLHALGQSAESHRRLREALTRAPGNRTLQREAAAILADWGEASEARKLLNIWVKGAGAQSSVWPIWVQAMEEIGAQAEIAPRLLRVLAAAPKKASLSQLGHLLDLLDGSLKAEKREDAYRALLDAWKTEGPRCEYLIRRSGLSGKLRMEGFLLAVQAGKKDPLAVRLERQRRLAEGYAELGQVPACRQAMAIGKELEESLKKQDERVPDWSLRALRVVYQIGDTQAGEELLKSFLAQGGGLILGNWVQAHEVLLRLDTEASRRRGAQLRREYFELRLERGGSESREVLGGLARELLTDGKVEEALRRLEEIVALDRNDAHAYAWAAALLEEFDFLPEASLYRQWQRQAAPQDVHASLKLGADLLQVPATQKAGLRILAELSQDAWLTDSTREQILHALKLSPPSSEAMKSIWVEGYPVDRRDSAECLEGLAFAALGRGELQVAGALLEQVGNLQPLQTRAWKARVELEERKPTDSSRSTGPWLQILRRREVLQDSGMPRWLRLRTFLQLAERGAAWSALEDVDLPRWLKEKLRGHKPVDPQELRWATILGGALEDRNDGYDDLDVGEEPEEEGEGEVNFSDQGPLGQLLDWGGDGGLGGDLFARPNPPPDTHEKLRRWSEGIPPSHLLQALSLSYQATGEVDLALGALELQQQEEPSADLTLRRNQLRELQRKRHAANERRLVLAKE
jgi:predicted Zn-dependent protease